MFISWKRNAVDAGNVVQLKDAPASGSWKAQKLSSLHAAFA